MDGNISDYNILQIAKQFAIILNVTNKAAGLKIIVIVIQSQNVKAAFEKLILVLFQVLNRFLKMISKIAYFKRIF